ncbi:MAG: glycosyltransferase family A protein [Phormidesmis sp.]
MKLTVMPPDLPLPDQTAAILCKELSNWKIEWPDSTPVAQRLNSKNFLLLADDIEAAGCSILWQSDSQDVAKDLLLEATTKDFSTKDFYSWSAKPSILALIPHWRCDPWLKRCLASLLAQTHPLTNIVVVDDGSAQPPLEIVKNYPTVTLLRSSDRVGPYQLIQSVIDKTDYTAYLFQDADDWSSGDRLKTLLKAARHSGAELIGSQEIRVLEPDLTLQSVGYPLDVNQALAQAPGHGLLHPTSLVTRSLVQRIGGFATGLRFGGDSEFLLRAQWAARIVNSSRYCYFRRKRPHSLTTAAKTGLESLARKQLTDKIKQQAIARSQSALRQQRPDLSPLCTEPPVKLTHLWGPLLRWISSR